jgi:hypothetical protein
MLVPLPAAVDGPEGGGTDSRRRDPGDQDQDCQEAQSPSHLITA